MGDKAQNKDIETRASRAESKRGSRVLPFQQLVVCGEDEREQEFPESQALTTDGRVFWD